MKKYDKESGKVFNVYLVDDGTLDTVLEVYDEEQNRTHITRFSECERNSDGSIPGAEFERLAEAAIEEYFEMLQLEY